MAYLVERLEKCLRAWEDWWFLLGVMNDVMVADRRPPVYPNENAVLHWHQFRKRLLSLGQEQIDIERFLPPKHKSFENSTLANFAVPLSQWCLNSRRIYNLTEELQVILDATSLEGVTWQDVCLPFPAFAIKLDRPMIDVEGTRFDFIMVTTFNVTNQRGTFPVVELLFFGEGLRPI